MSNLENESWHGTLTGYTNHKCKCDSCKENWRDYIARYRKRTLQVKKREPYKRRDIRP